MAKIKSDYTLKPIELEDVTKPWIVVCFGMVSYRILSEHATKRRAEDELRMILAREDRMKAAAAGYTSKPLPQDFDVRTPDDMHALNKAILDSYNHENRRRY